MVDTAAATVAVKTAALQAGFTQVGIARAEALVEERARLEEWLRRGHHAGMAWLARDVTRRCDPREVLPGARSVIVVSCTYLHGGEEAEAPPRHGKIARYARGRDYHRVLRRMLRKVEAAIQHIDPEARSRSFVDSGPVLEKAWAVRAGLGWIGKHTNLISRTQGSWFFLAVVLTTAAFEYDAPAADHCGTCTACIDACPTHAIPEPYVLDAHACIPYLTIELRDPVMPELEYTDFRNWVFGCDICQEVCPWNRFASETQHDDLRPRAATTLPSLDWLADIDEQEFVRAFAGTPVMRAKAAGMRRNARWLLRESDSGTEGVGSGESGV